MSVTDDTESILAGIVEAIARCKCPPTLACSVSCDCPLYQRLKQQPTWEHACTRNLDLISMRPTKADWAAHVRTEHATVFQAIQETAQHLAAHASSCDAPCGASGCPFGCSGFSIAGPRAIASGTLPVAATASLADRMMAAIRADQVRSANAMKGPSGDAGSGVTQRRMQLAAHLAEHHLVELQFMAAYAHELASCACSPAILGSHGMDAGSPVPATPPRSKASSKGGSSCGPVQSSVCPFHLLAATKKTRNGADTISAQQMNGGRGANSTQHDGDGDDDASDLVLLSACDGARSIFRRGSEAAAAAHLLACHSPDLVLLAKHTAQQCRQALSAEENHAGRCYQPGCQVGIAGARALMRPGGC